MTIPALPEHFSLMDFNGRVHRVEPLDFKLAILKHPCGGMPEGTYVGACYLTKIKAPKNAHLDGLYEYYIYLPNGQRHKVTEKDLDLNPQVVRNFETAGNRCTYPTRTLEIHGYGTRTIATRELELLLIGEDGSPRDEKCEEIDSRIFFYVDWQEMLKSDEDLRQFIEESLVPDHSDTDHEGN